MSNFIANSFQVPNALIDEMLDKISGNACKIYLLIVRKTRGWHKETDRISYSQIKKATGIGSYATIDKALSELVEIGLISVKSGNEKQANEYRLNDDFTITKTVKPKNCSTTKTVKAITENVKAITETVKGGITETVNTEIHSFKNTNNKYTKEKDKSENPKTQKTSSVKKPSDVSDDVWQDLLHFRKQKTKTDMTATAWKRNESELRKAQSMTGESMDELIAFWLSAGWQGFNAKWYLNRIQDNEQGAFLTELQAVDNKFKQNPFANPQAFIGADHE
ncbi:replication protein [Moraxella nasovis]|uniref:replication protein n=1 Tax=Moraxella nasovis TaxID=2904121 RepID=UPI001F602FB2|nr:replication protein [Moraxella nasovis]UNU74136.1 replication protein [Moraxella nasovis]